MRSVETRLDVLVEDGSEEFGASKPNVNIDFFCEEVDPGEELKFLGEDEEVGDGMLKCPERVEGDLVRSGGDEVVVFGMAVEST
jgi:hypothetical protein